MKNLRGNHGDPIELGFSNFSVCDPKNYLEKSHDPPDVQNTK